MILNNFDDLFPDLSTKAFKKGEIVYDEGSRPTGIYFIQSGIIGLYHLAENGKETFLRVFGPGNLLGHRSYFADEFYHATSIAVNDAKLIYIPKEVLEEHLDQKPETLRLILTQVSSDLGKAELRMSGRHDKSAGGRIIESIVFLKLHYPEQIWTRKQIADYSGSTFETVTRVINKLEKDGEITKNGRDFTINSPDQLLEKISEY